MLNDKNLITRLLKEFHIGSNAYGCYKLETKSRIVSFASLGAKNYSYDTRTGERCIKSRGFDLKSKKAKTIINHKKMKEMVLNFFKEEFDVVECKTFRMKIDRKKAKISNSSFDKKYSNSVFDKRYFFKENNNIQNTNICTLPFGLKSYDFADCEKEDVFN